MHNQAPYPSHNFQLIPCLDGPWWNSWCFFKLGGEIGDFGLAQRVFCPSLPLEVGSFAAHQPSGALFSGKTRRFLGALSLYADSLPLTNYEIVLQTRFKPLFLLTRPCVSYVVLLDLPRFPRKIVALTFPVLVASFPLAAGRRRDPSAYRTVSFLRRRILLQLWRNGGASAKISMIEYHRRR